MRWRVFKWVDGGLWCARDPLSKHLFYFFSHARAVEFVGERIRGF